MDVESESVPKVQDLARLDDTKEEKIDVEPNQDEKSSEENCCSKKKNIIITVSVIGALVVIGIIIAVATGSKGDASTASEVAQNVCMPNPCKHNGDCSEDQNGQAKCNCKEEWDGETCEKQKDFCKPDNPCLNNGVCSSEEKSCDCKSTDFYGKTCDSISLTAVVINDTERYKPCLDELKDCPKPQDEVCLHFFCYPENTSGIQDSLKTCTNDNDCKGPGIRQTAKCARYNNRKFVCVSEKDYDPCTKHTDCDGKGGKCCFGYCCNKEYFEELKTVVESCDENDADIKKAKACKADKKYLWDDIPSKWLRWSRWSTSNLVIFSFDQIKTNFFS